MTCTLVTGATGLVGFHIVHALLARQREVRVLARNTAKAKELLPKEVEVVAGDVTDLSSMVQAAHGATAMYHAAGLPEQWFKDPGIFKEVNVGGTANAIEAALQAGVQRFVYTSTIDVFTGRSGELYNETHLDPHPKGTHYERSKQLADKLVVQAIRERELPAVFLFDLVHGKTPILPPGGFPMVYAPDCGMGHVLAEEKGTIGERFILSEKFYHLYEIAQEIQKQTGAKVPPTMPMWFAQIVSLITEAVSKVIQLPPLLPQGQLHFLQWGAIPDSSKAQEKLGMNFTSMTEGVQATLAWKQSGTWSLSKS
jgi:dihydroflavonol-4-reductase